MVKAQKMQRIDELTGARACCGAGAPCRALAEDIVRDNAVLTQCIIKLREKVDELESE